MVRLLLNPVKNKSNYILIHTLCNFGSYRYIYIKTQTGVGEGEVTMHCPDLYLVDSFPFWHLDRVEQAFWKLLGGGEAWKKLYYLSPDNPQT